MANALNLLGCGSGGSSSNPTAPDAPLNFEAVAGDQLVTLSWDASVGADEYALYANDFDDFNAAALLVNGITDLSIVDSSGPKGDRRYYWIVASNGVGDSSPSTVAFARPYVTVANGATANLTTPTGSWMLTTLFFRSGGVLPFGCNVAANEGADIVVSLGDGTWENQTTFEAPYDVAVSGAFTFFNDAGASVTFWNTEP